MIGNHGLMGKTYERIDSYYTGTECDEEKLEYAEKSIYEVVGEVAIVDGIYMFSRKLVGKEVAMINSKYAYRDVDCADLTPEDGKFYSMDDLVNCRDSTGVDIFAHMREDISNAAVEDKIDFEIIDNKQFYFEGQEMRNYVSDEGCEGISFDLNLAIVIIPIVVIIMIVLIVVLTRNSSRKKLETQPVAPEPQAPVETVSASIEKAIAVETTPADKPIPTPSLTLKPTSTPYAILTPTPTPTPPSKPIANPVANSDSISTPIPYAIPISGPAPPLEPIPVIISDYSQ